MAEASPERVFVYGTLRRGGGHPMAFLLARRARPLGAATFRGVLLDVGPYPAAVASDAEGDVIHGELLELDPASAADTLARLDAYEGCPDADHHPALFVRSAHRVRRAEGGEARAWVWLWNRSVAGLARIPSGDWLTHVRSQAPDGG